MLPVRIVGTGVAGLSLALALCQAGSEDIELFAGNVEPHLDGGLVLSPNATRILNALGLGQAVANNSTQPSLMVERAWRSGYLLTQRPLGNFTQQRYGAAHVVIAEPVLEDIIRTQLASYGVPIHAGAPLHPGAPLLPSRGEHIVVGCDGASSVVRQAMGYPPAHTASGYVAWRARLPSTDAPTALEPNAIATWSGPQQIFRHWPSPNGQDIELLAIHPDIVQDLGEAYAHWHPAIPRAIQHSVDHHAQPLLESPPLRQWYRDHQVLLGDACHLAHPYLQQSTALAMEDAWVLARMLDRWEEQIATAFGDYERYRKVRLNRVRVESKTSWEQAILPRGFLAQRRNLRISLTNRFLPEMAMQQLDWLYGYDCISGFD